MATEVGGGDAKGVGAPRGGDCGEEARVESQRGVLPAFWLGLGFRVRLGVGVGLGFGFGFGFGFGLALGIGRGVGGVEGGAQRCHIVVGGGVGGV